MSEIPTFDVLVEIPKGSRNKFEYDFEKKRIRFDRVLYSAMFYLVILRVELKSTSPLYKGDFIHKIKSKVCIPPCKGG